MTNLRILRFRWLGVAAVLLAVLVIAACGSDPTATPEPTAAPEPTATPAPTATPEPTEPPMMMMDDLEITPATTGQDLVSHISEAEAGCLSSAMGDANFHLFQGAPLMLAAANEGAYGLLATCLEKDSLVLLGVGLMSANAGDWSGETLECATGLGKEHAELIYLALGVSDQISDPSHPGEIHPGPRAPLAASSVLILSHSAHRRPPLAPPKRLKTPANLPSTRIRARIIALVTPSLPFHCPHTVHPCPSVDSG